MPTTAKTFSVRNGIDVANTIIVSNTSGVLNVSNITLINATASNIGTTGTYTNGSIVIGGVSNLNFNNSASVTWTITANGFNQANISAAATSTGGGGANVVTVNANDTTVLANALINFNNTATINVVASANGTYESNIAFNANILALAALIGPFVVDRIVYSYFSGV